jgi:hypothetical protein
LNTTRAIVVRVFDGLKARAARWFDLAFQSSPQLPSSRVNWQGY